MNFQKLAYAQFHVSNHSSCIILLLFRICSQNVPGTLFLFNYLLITNVTTSLIVLIEAPSVIISIDPSSATSFAAVGVAVSISPAADPDCVTVIAPPVIAVPPISKVIPPLAVPIAPCSAVIIFITLPPSGTGTNVDDAVLMSAIVDVIN